MKYKHTNKRLNNVSKLLTRGLRKQLLLQKHYATGKLSRSITGLQEKKGDSLLLNIISNKSYWRVVNDPRVAFSVNKSNIIRWMNTKGLDSRFATAIYKRLKRGVYGKEKEKYVYWEEGNSIQRINFAGIVAKENSQKVAEELAPSIGKDVAEMVAKQIRKNNPKTNVVKAF